MIPATRCETKWLTIKTKDIILSIKLKECSRVISIMTRFSFLYWTIIVLQLILSFLELVRVSKISSKLPL